MRGDLIAGLTVAALIVPKNLGYAGIAGVPLQNGLYAAAEVVVFRLDGGLFFATSEALEDRIRELIHSTPDLTGMVLDCEGIDIDSQGSAKLGEIVGLTEQSGITLRLARVKPAVSTTLGKDGVLDLIGSDKIHGNVHRAVSAQLDAPPAEETSRE